MIEHDQQHSNGTQALDIVTMFEHCDRFVSLAISSGRMFRANPESEQGLEGANDAASHIGEYLVAARHVIENQREPPRGDL